METAAAPAILFVRGALTEDDTRGISIIGTRQPSGQGLETANQIAQAVVADGRTVISGLALGIDTAAHAGALGVGGRSIAVLGNGLQHVYPSANTNLQERLDGLVSQFLPGQEPNRKTFPERNAVMSGLSAATVIVEAGEFSGARIQARHALAQGRRLFLIAPLLDQQWALALASQAGASVIHTAAQLIAGINQWTD